MLVNAPKTLLKFSYWTLKNNVSANCPFPFYFSARILFRIFRRERNGFYKGNIVGLCLIFYGSRQALCSFAIFFFIMWQPIWIYFIAFMFICYFCFQSRSLLYRLTIVIISKIVSGICSLPNEQQSIKRLHLSICKSANPATFNVNWWDIYLFRP